MKRDEYALKIKEASMDLIYRVMDEIKADLSPQGVLKDIIDDMEGEYIREVDELSVQQLIDQRHSICSVEQIGDKIKHEVIERLL